MAVNPAVGQLPDNYKFGWEDKDAVYRNVKKKGLSEDVVREYLRRLSTFDRHGVIDPFRAEAVLGLVGHGQREVRVGKGKDLHGSCVPLTR